MPLKKSIFRLLLVLGLIYYFTFTGSVSASSSYYVDPKNGKDSNSGSLSTPFKSLEKALQVVSDRVDSGIRSDKIYLRGGRYRSSKTSTCYQLNLKGTVDNYAKISAMPCQSHDSGAVQRKSGQWYEKVVFDDGYQIKTAWEKIGPNSKIWKTNPGYVRLEWIHQNLWPWTGTSNGFPITDNDLTPETTLFTVAPYMLLQDNKPFLWVDEIKEITEPGMRTYDHLRGMLYIWPFDDKDPNDCIIESWYGGPQVYNPGTLHLDGEGRGIFDGNLEYATIQGFEFRMLTRLFEFHRRGYKNEQERVVQRYVRVEDNFFQYCWIHILLDANTIWMPDTKELIRPRYGDRSNWRVANNVFYRPSREVCQLHGDNHVIEYNEIIDHNGPWAGPAACVSAINTRNTRNAQICYNFINGQGNNKWHPGSVFMIEVSGGLHKDRNGDYTLGGQTYEYNFVSNVTAGPVMFLGKGNTRMKNITVRNNIFYNNLGGPAIRISSPHDNLIIKNNIFYNQSDPIQIYPQASAMTKPPLSNTMDICKNIFMNNIHTIDKALFMGVSGSKVTVDKNLFYNNQEPGMGTNLKTGDPLFLDPKNFDFRIEPNSPANIEGEDIGVYEHGCDVPAGTEWWLTKDTSPSIIPAKNKSEF